LIAIDVRPAIGDSLDLDSATQAAYPNDHRWDYVLSVLANGDLVGVEPHTAKNSEIDVVIKKKTNAAAHLRLHLHPGRAVARWYWVTRGKVAFSPMEKAERKLAQNGIKFSRVLRSLHS
jgi:hypothetical protein